MTRNWRTGDAVVVEHGGSWWEATVIATSDEGFRIHYVGGEDSEDEWVGPERIGPSSREASKPPFVRPVIETTTTGYRERFTEMVRALGAIKDVVIDEVCYGEPASEDEISRARERSGGALPIGLETFCRQMNGFTLRWHVDGSEPRIVGSILLLPLLTDGESIYGDWRDVVWFEEGDSFYDVRPFDFFTNEACAAFSPVPGEATVHFHTMGESLEPTGYDFAEYVELLLRSRGLWYWQLALCVDEQSATDLARFRETMPSLFPDYDDAVFTPGTEEGTRGR